MTKPDILERLAHTIAERSMENDDSSWTAKLLDGGVKLCAKKTGEEAVETIIAALSGDKTALVHESADLLYHWLVLLKAAGVDASDVYAELARREGKSGIEEKASRKS